MKRQTSLDTRGLDHRMTSGTTDGSASHDVQTPAAVVRLRCAAVRVRSRR